MSVIFLCAAERMVREVITGHLSVSGDIQSPRFKRIKIICLFHLVIYFQWNCENNLLENGVVWEIHLYFSIKR